MITIKNDIAFKDGKEIGTIRKFCCGIDFRPKGKPNALFSILKARNDEKLKICISALSEIKVPKKRFHWNFNHEIATNEARLADYKNRLENLGKEIINEEV